MGRSSPTAGAVGDVMVLLAVWPCLRWQATRHFKNGLALDNATGSAFDADQVTETDVVGGDVVAL
jgi:hypothetical protein